MLRVEQTYDNKNRNCVSSFPVWEDCYVRPDSLYGDVIYVDTSRLNFAWLISFLKKNYPNYFSVWCTGRPFDVTTLYTKLPFTVLLTDLVLPKCRATKWLLPYKEFLNDHKVGVIFTGVLEEKDFWQIVQLDGWSSEDFCFYIQKPWNMQKLIQIMTGCVLLEYT